MGTESDLGRAFEKYREVHNHGWGLAWYLAAEFCERFYSSHGIVPQVIDHDGPGPYYGIMLRRVQCPVHGQKDVRLGRFSMAGDVENWRTGSPGDHGLKLAERVEKGEPIDGMVAEAIRHLGIPRFPKHSHYNCRHKRWGDSYRLVFRLAALFALHPGIEGDFYIWNAPETLEMSRMPKDPLVGMKEHPGHFLFTKGEKRVVIAGDGRVLKPARAKSLWERYMGGESIGDLLGWLAGVLV